jgi:cyclopropane-fatty-acyl-phospholipid synthase
VNAEGEIRTALASAGVEVGGDRPWDIQVNRPELYARVFAEGSVGAGEAYMDGWWDCPALDEFFLRVVSADLGGRLKPNLHTLGLALSARLQNRQSRHRALQAVKTHYDLDVAVFEATFDRRLTGSCGYWKNAGTLDEAQEAKLDLVCRKIGLTANQHVLDIGCGWGAFMGFAAERYGASCVGVTVSEQQVDYARKRYAGLPADFQLMDYRAFDGSADHVVSMGMFEHVGPRNYRTYFARAQRALRPGGVFLLHTIFANEREATIDPWLDRYIFPSGALPTVGQIATAVEGLFVIEDVENFGPDYDRTLMAWRENFRGHWPELSDRYGERFCRMWDYYLSCCAGAFRSRAISVGHFVLSPAGVPGGWRRPASA